MSDQQQVQDPVIAHLMGQARSAVVEIQSAVAADLSPSITDGRLLMQAFRTLEDLLTEGWALPRDWQSVGNDDLSTRSVTERMQEMHAACAAVAAAVAVNPDEADLERLAAAFVDLDEILSAGGPMPMKWVVGTDNI